MIKLTRTKAPLQLTEDFVKLNTQRYKETKDCVWNVDWLKEALMKMSNSKCAYCEGRLGYKSEYMEVEHFKDKRDYPDDVLSWENLLPSCKHCNGHKSTHDVVAEPIINPFVDVPKEHLFLKSYLYKSKDSLGRCTIDVLDLNDSTRLVKARFELGTVINQLLEKRLEEIESGLKIGRKQKSFQNSMRDLLVKCLPQSEYAAVCSTELITSSEYPIIVEKMKKLDLWLDEFEDYHQTILSIALI